MLWYDSNVCLFSHSDALSKCHCKELVGCYSCLKCQQNQTTGENVNKESRKGPDKLDSVPREMRSAQLEQPGTNKLQ